MDPKGLIGGGLDGDNAREAGEVWNECRLSARHGRAARHGVVWTHCLFYHTWSLLAQKAPCVAIQAVRPHNFWPDRKVPSCSQTAGGTGTVLKTLVHLN